MSTLQALGFLLPSGFLLAQEGPVDLYLEPDIASSQVATVSLDDPRLGSPLPVMDDAKAALGWHSADFEGSVTGFVPDAEIGKDLLPVDNSPVYSEPSPESPVLALYRDGDPFKVVDTGTWWKCEIETAFPVYFVLESVPALPPVSGEAIVELELYPEEEPSLLDTPAAPATAPNRVAPAGEPNNLDESPPLPQGIMGKSFEGTFKKSERRFGLFAPKEPFYLADARGRRIVWVDTSNIVVPGSLRAFLDKRVIIHGNRQYEQASGDWVLQARNMRLK